MQIDQEWRKAFPWSLFWHPGFLRFSTWVYDHVLQGCYLGWVWPFMFGAGALLFTSPSQLVSQNPLLWRSFTPSDPLMVYMHTLSAPWAGFSNHHTLNIIAEAALCVALAGWFARAQKTEMVQWGLLASYGAILTWAVHEGLWWVTYAILWQPPPIVYSGFGELITFSLLVLTPMLGLYAPKRFFTWMLAFQVAWAVAGFPITESFNGDTPKFYDLGTNFWEFASWMWAAVGFYWLERDGLLGWMFGIRKLITLNQ